ncbi:T9SS type A sorting domain-containing protein [Mariniflexile sp.]|uniref:T9SS type A sorting domain-containing protein n=1 Tax=Mariniflexile sp. TaxID=1979402 RepID=UPI0040488FBA
MKYLLIPILFAGLQSLQAQKGLFISSDGFLHNENSVITIVDGEFVSESSTVLNGGSLHMKGLDGNAHQMVLNYPNTLNYLELYGSSTLELEGALTLNGELLLEDTAAFKMNTGSQLTLGPTAEIVGESNTNTINGADGTYIKTTRNHAAGVTNDFGQIGVETRNGSTMGSTEIFRRYGTFDIAGNPTVRRYYEVNPTVNTGLNMEARFSLTDNDLNGLNRNNLAAFRSTDNGTTFTNEGGTPTTFYHSVSNIDAFSLWFFADASSLSVENLTDFGESISIAPNPASHHVNILSNNGTDITSVELFNVSGQQIQAHVTNNNMLDVRNLSDGMYFLKINSQKGSATKKLIVKR